MAELHLVSELKAKEKSRVYHVDLLRRDPLNWSHKVVIETLEAEIQELKKAVCVTEMQQCC
jgi:hypothetical protein